MISSSVGNVDVSAALPAVSPAAPPASPPAAPPAALPAAPLLNIPYGRTLTLPLAEKVESRSHARRLQNLLQFLGIRFLEYYPPVQIRNAFGGGTVSYIVSETHKSVLKENLTTLAENLTLTPDERIAALAQLTCTIMSDGMVYLPQYWSVEDVMAPDWVALAGLARQDIDTLGFEHGQYHVLDVATSASNTILSGASSTVPSTMMAFQLNSITVARTYKEEPHPMVEKVVKALGGAIPQVGNGIGCRRVVFHASIPPAEMMTTIRGIY